MAKAILEITADNSSVRRALGEIPTLSKRAADAIKRDFGQISTVGLAEFSKLSREAARNLSAISRAEDRVSQSRARREQTDLTLALATETRKTRVAKEESEKRVRIPYREADEIVKAKKTELTESERIEREKTRIVQREATARARAIAQAELGTAAGGGGQPSGRSYRSRWMDLTFNAGRAARDTLGQIHSQVQGARERDADIQRTLGLALYQAGGDRQDVVSARRRFGQFAAENGLDAAELAQAANAAQTEFSIFGDRSTGAGERNTRIESFLQTALLARNTGNDIGETARLTGLFANQGLDANTQRQMVLFAAGASQRGAVEMGMLTRSAMPAVTNRISQAMAGLGANATSEQRQAAAQNAFIQSYAELQVARGSEGMTPRMAGNAMAAMNTALQSDVTQQRILTNIHNARGLTAQQRAQLEGQLFQRDARGHSTLRQTDALGFLSSASTVIGNDPTAFNNLFAGGGQGNPQSLQANWRRIAGGFLGTDAEGQTGLQRIKSLMDVGATSLNQADVDRGGRVFGTDPRADLNRNMEAQQNELRNNTNALVRMSDQLANWQARNPMASSLLGGTAAGLGGALMQRVGTFQLAANAAPAAAAPGAAAAAAPLGLGGFLGVAASGAAGVGAGYLATRAIDTIAERKFNLHHGQGYDQGWNLSDLTRSSTYEGAGEAGPMMGARERRAVQQVAAGNATSFSEIAAAIRSALEGARLNVAIDPHQAALAAAQTASGANSPPPEHRR